jgi:hypothetical protein
MRCRWQNDGVVYSALYMFLSMPLSKNQFDAKEKLCSTNTMFITSFLAREGALLPILLFHLAGICQIFLPSEYIYHS